jgi:hypothetical protein
MWQADLERELCNTPFTLDTRTVALAKCLIARELCGGQFRSGRCGVCKCDAEKVAPMNIMESGGICIPGLIGTRHMVCLDCVNQMRTRDTQVFWCCVCGLVSVSVGTLNMLPCMTQIGFGPCGHVPPVHVCDKCLDGYNMFQFCGCCDSKAVVFVEHKNDKTARICVDCFEGNKINAKEYISAKLARITSEKTITQKLINLEAENLSGVKI